MKLYHQGNAIGLSQRTVAKITTELVPDNRCNYFLLAPIIILGVDYTGFAAVFTIDAGGEGIKPGVPLVSGFEDFEFLKPGYIVSVEPTGFTRVLYRPEANDNAMFVTARCNNNCIMCSQPPKESIEIGWVESHLKVIDLIDDSPATLCITGGEPTLLGGDLVKILTQATVKLPNTNLYMLTNGRSFTNENFVKEIASIPRLRLLSAIPLYADVAPIHNYIVQSENAFNETVQGLYNMARYNLPVEIRIVLHKQTLLRLLPLMDFIYHNFPFVSHVALMGLENMGYAKKNWELLWVDPVDYKDDLLAAVRFLHYRRICVSVYNLPLCIISKELWPFARRSISDFKNIYLEECEHCGSKSQCCGFFKSSETAHSVGIRRI